MALALVVVEPFKDYKRGDQITDPQMVKDVLASDQQGHVVRTNVPDPQPAPQNQ